ncbi:MAG: hypothetical protein ACXU9C_19885 [Xanthobacteraceae bacterium]
MQPNVAAFSSNREEIKGFGPIPAQRAVILPAVGVADAKTSSLAVDFAFIRRSFFCAALGFALGQLLLLLFLFFFDFRAGGSLSLRPVSTVIRLEGHRIPLVRGLIPCLIPLYMRVFEFCLSLLFAPPRALPKTTLKSDALLHDAAGRRW